MADFTDDRLRVETAVRNFKAEVSLRIYDSKQDTLIFNGYIYRLYDNHIFNNLMIKDMEISLHDIWVSIKTEGREYERFLQDYKITV